MEFKFKTQTVPKYRYEDNGICAKRQTVSLFNEIGKALELNLVNKSVRNKIC